ncbi:chromosomal replication initiator protein DnaA [Mahella australiensis]|uniref:Chromosomal replication initiator protein DnaA n=1 Tax=Mahella australiensis (strain DSM 15567 / CIP 107919 / 50-1 BON) TaxID=697281 RepID=F4A310_MAHA5|nr:chromosomal replication initiator protein DnaA [Mahella australiensis]AEE95225.1 chromosomal replication initiator protein DnaA [Mahella australiensis 50-1 BON]
MHTQADEVWYKVIAALNARLTQVSLNSWLKNVKPIGIYEHTLVLAVSNKFLKTIVESRYSNYIYDALKDIAPEISDVEIMVAVDDDIEEYKAQMTPNDNTPADNKQDTPKDEALSAISQNDTLNPKYTFDTFVIGNSNRFAHAASLAVAEAPGKAYNPLFIYGGVGLGKTHLMHAIGHRILENNPGIRLMYVTSEKFTNELINSIKDDRNEVFRNKYRNIDVLLIDDIQFIANKERTQEEFFHTFNTLYETNHQIIISSDRPPKDIPTLEDRLRSRFEWGLLADIQPPDLETRIAILRKKADMENIKVADDILLFIAQQIQSNIRELEGALVKIMAYASLNERNIDIDVAGDVLKDIIKDDQPQKITVDRIQKIVSNYFNMKPDDFKAKKRSRAISYPRQIAMYLCREMTDLSLPKIGEEFGGRDHTTVIHACEKIMGDMEKEPEIKLTINELKKRIQSN